jgi:hypothetical protein
VSGVYVHEDAGQSCLVGMGHDCMQLSNPCIRATLDVIILVGAYLGYLCSYAEFHDQLGKKGYEDRIQNTTKTGNPHVW